MGIRFLGTGSALPEQVVTNDELSEFLDTSDEWIQTRTGIKERRIMTSETLTELASQAALNAIESSGISPSELDLIICTTIRGDYITPSLACMVQKNIGAGCPAYDINGACSGFVFALDLADSYLLSGKAKKILIVSAEAMSKTVDWNDRATCVLFGDGAGAVVIESSDELFNIKLTVKGDNSTLYTPHVHGNCPYDKTEPTNPYLYMAGPDVYKFAVNTITSELTSMFEKLNINAEKLDYLFLHQANLRIIKAAQMKLGIPSEKVALNIPEKANTSSACIPIMLDEYSRKGIIKKGHLIGICAFGAGMTTGTCIMRW